MTDNKTEATTKLTYNNKRIYKMNDIFRREDERLKTFGMWPLEWLDKCRLARTGMFYTGEGDKVKCYFCEVEIRQWKETDHPVREHMKWSPSCPLLRRRTTNNVPICAEALHRVLPPQSYDICGAYDAIEIRPYAYAEGSIVMPARVVQTTLAPPNSMNTVVVSMHSSPVLHAEECRSANLTAETSTAAAAIPEEKLCKICYASEYNTAFLPCGHVLACAKCASSVTKCPLCRKPFTDVMRVYFS